MEAYQMPGQYSFVVIPSIFVAYNMDLPVDGKQKLGKLTEDKDFFDYLRETALQKETEKKPGASSEELKKNAEQFFDTVCRNDSLLLNNYLAFTEQKILKEKYPDEADRIQDTLKSSFKDKGEKCRYDHVRVKAAYDQVSLEDLASLEKPWAGEKENDSSYIRRMTELGYRDNLEAGNLYARMGNIAELYDQMQRSMKSTFRDSREYKQMMEAMKTVKDLHKEGPKTDSKSIDDYNDAMREVMKKVGVYIDTHQSNRSTRLGKDRFEAAFAALAVVNENIADRVAGKINQIRSKEKKPQLIDLAKVNRHLGMPEYKGAALNRHIDEVKESKSVPLSEKDFSAKAARALSKNARNRILPADERKKLAAAGKNAGVIDLENPGKAPSQILGYMKWTQNCADKSAQELTGKAGFTNAAAEYRKFLEENAVYQDNQLVNNEKLEKSFRNMAEFQKGWIRNLKKGMIPDYGDEEFRKQNTARLLDLKRETIDCMQGMGGLPKIGLHDESCVVFFLDRYGSEQYEKDMYFLNNMSAFLEAVSKIDDPEASFSEKMIGRLAVDLVKEAGGTGKSPEEFFSLDGGGDQFASTLQAYTSVMAPVFSGWPPEKQDEYKAYIYGDERERKDELNNILYSASNELGEIVGIQQDQFEKQMESLRKTYTEAHNSADRRVFRNAEKAFEGAQPETKKESKEAAVRSRISFEELKGNGQHKQETGRSKTTEDLTADSKKNAKRK